MRQQLSRPPAALPAVPTCRAAAAVRRTCARATISYCCARMSTSLPLPSSPHCVPSTTQTCGSNAGSAAAVAWQRGADRSAWRRARGAGRVLLAGRAACSRGSAAWGRQVAARVHGAPLGAAPRVSCACIVLIGLVGCCSAWLQQGGSSRSDLPPGG